MVTIVNYKERLKDDGTSFFVLELQGGIEMTQSKTTGMFYATAKKASIPTTFNETTCQGLIGTQLEGSIIKVDSEPYEYVIEETGEEILLAHRWVYSPEPQDSPSALQNKDSNEFSSTIMKPNSTLEHSFV